MREIEGRRFSTLAKIEDLRGRLSEASSLIAGKACVFATGSFGRLEAGPESDLDVCIVGLEIGGVHIQDRKRALSNLNTINVKADFIKAIRDLGIKDLDGDGRYFRHYTVRMLTSALGQDNDDFRNFLTTRLLVLLEGKPVIGEDVQDEVIGDLIGAYWRDYDNHRDDFIPAFLGNDILRLWRTFCVNYEARTKRSPDEQKEKGKIKNYKLKHSRLMTCYSALIYLLQIYEEKKTVSISDAQQMVRLTPTERIAAVGERNESVAVRELVKKIFDSYEWFLISTASEKDLGAKLMDQAEKGKYADNTFDFGNHIFDLMKVVGNENRFYRLLVV